MIQIMHYQSEHRDAILGVSLAAWGPVFPAMQKEVQDYVFDAFYPHGWQARQMADICALLDDQPELIWVALIEGEVAGWIGGRIHPEDRMGEVYILAVSPGHQRKGVARMLMDQLFDYFRTQDLVMVMVETGADSGHAASRATYESADFERWPVARYFRKI